MERSQRYVSLSGCCIPVYLAAKYPVVVAEDGIPGQGWTPVPLRARFWIPLVTFMILLAIGLEIALHYSNVQQGTSVPSVASF
jgi:hypothetical protein